MPKTKKELLTSTLEIFQALVEGAIIVETHRPEQPGIDKNGNEVIFRESTFYRLDANAKCGFNATLCFLKPSVFENLRGILEEMPCTGYCANNQYSYKWYRLRTPTAAVLCPQPNIHLTFTKPDEEEIAWDEDLSPEELVALAEELRAKKASTPMITKHFKTLSQDTTKVLDILEVLRQGGIICEIMYPTDEIRQQCVGAPDKGNKYRYMRTAEEDGYNEICGNVSKNIFVQLKKRRILTELPFTGTNAVGAVYKWYRLQNPDFARLGTVPGVDTIYTPLQPNTNTGDEQTE